MLRDQIEKEVHRIIERRGAERLAEHVYGLNHELIGKPCLYDGKPAIPYGAYILGEEVKDHAEPGLKLAIVYFDEISSLEGVGVHVNAMSGVTPDQLIPIDPSSKKAKEVYHTILSWLVDNRSGTFRDLERKTEEAKT